VRAERAVEPAEWAARSSGASLRRGFSIVAQRAGVSISAVSTDSVIADTIVIENCR
jgi:hypothetical protein